MRQDEPFKVDERWCSRGAAAAKQEDARVAAEWPTARCKGWQWTIRFAAKIWIATIRAGSDVSTTSTTWADAQLKPGTGAITSAASAGPRRWISTATRSKSGRVPEQPTVRACW